MDSWCGDPEGRVASSAVFFTAGVRCHSSSASLFLGVVGLALPFPFDIDNDHRNECGRCQKHGGKAHVTAVASECLTQHLLGR